MNTKEILLSGMPETPDRFRKKVAETTYECTRGKETGGHKKHDISYKKNEFRYGFVAAIVLLVGGSISLAYTVPKLTEFMSNHGFINERNLNRDETAKNRTAAITCDTETMLKVDEAYLDGMNMCFTMHSEDENCRITGVGDHVTVNGVDRVTENFDVSADGVYFVSIALDMNLYEGHVGEKPLSFKSGDEVNVEMKLYIDGIDEKVPYSFNVVIGDDYSGYAEIPNQRLDLKSGVSASVHDSFISDSVIALNVSFEGENASNKDVYEIYIADNEASDFWIEYLVEYDSGERENLQFDGVLGDEWNINIKGMGRDTDYLRLIPCRYAVDKDSGKPDYSNPEVLEEYSFSIKLK